MEKSLRNILPSWLRQQIRQWRKIYRIKKAIKINFKYDKERFSQYGCPDRLFRNQEHLRSYIIMLYHSLEKGLALPNPRPGFGKDKALILIDSIEQYFDQYNPDEQIEAAIKALDSYIRFNVEHNNSIAKIEDKVQKLKVHLTEYSLPLGIVGGIHEITKKEIWESSKIDLEFFFKNRYSIRQFDSLPVDIDLIVKAIQMAQKTPSVCNRQSGKVYVFDNDEKGKAILSCQNGNRGFGHTADKILIVTSELGVFLDVGERNQCWIDGGLFAMSLIYALHSLGLGTCCLNWSVEKESDIKMRKIAGVKDSENIIMLIAVGHIPEKLMVAASQRKSISKIAYFHTAIQPIMEITN